MTHSKEARKRCDARRLQRQSAKGAVWKNRPVGYDAERMKKMREENGREPRFMIDKAFAPLSIKSDAIAVAADWHVPFYDPQLMLELIYTCEERGITELAIPGDLWDCDNYSKFVHLGWHDCFRSEIEEVRSVMITLSEQFDKIYVCRGNHEKRWIDMNAGMMGMKELFALLQVDTNYTVTLDDHIKLESGGRGWLLAHPRNFRQINLSVARDLAAKYQTNIFSAHGHQWAQGQDRSGKFDLVDGGGLFDPYALEYLRQTNCYPAVQGGFYLIIDGKAIPYKNENPTHQIGFKKEVEA